MVLLGVKAQVEAHFGPFAGVVVLTLDRGTVCAECTIGSEIIMDALDGTPGDMGHVKCCFGPFGDGVSVVVR
jgi:hypothetical protein